MRLALRFIIQAINRDALASILWSEWMSAGRGEIFIDYDSGNDLIVWLVMSSWASITPLSNNVVGNTLLRRHIPSPRPGFALNMPRNKTRKLTAGTFAQLSYLYPHVKALL